MDDKDVTDLVSFGNPDDECLPLMRCVCGTTFPEWEEIIGIYREHPHECSVCHRKLYFRNSIIVYEVVEPPDNVEAK